MKLCIRSILWPTDFSPLSLAAADIARELAHTFDATLHIVHVAPLLMGDAAVGMGVVDDRLVSVADVRGLALEELARLARDYFPDGPPIVREARVGTPWQEVCEYAKDAAIDWIVIATHGRTGLRHALLGSVAERVVQHAACPVLVVKSFDLARVG